MSSMVYTTLVLTSLGGLFGHHARRPGLCITCGEPPAAILTDIQVLQTCPNWRERDRAARRLRRYDWHCHPEVAAVLATALLTDRCEEVREEAAESLTRLAPCVPEAHAALRHAADADPDRATRKWARRGLRALGGRCV